MPLYLVRHFHRFGSDSFVVYSKKDLAGDFSQDDPDEAKSMADYLGVDFSAKGESPFDEPEEMEVVPLYGVRDVDSGKDVTPYAALQREVQQDTDIGG